MLFVILLFLASLTASLIAIYVIITIGYGFKEAVLGSDTISSDYLVADFDQPGNPAASTLGGNMPLALEGATGRGDSGGGLFVNANGTDYLVGLATFGQPNAAGTFSTYGLSSTFLDLASPGVRNFIAQTAPELGISTVMDATAIHSLSDTFTGVTVGDAVQQNNQIGWVSSNLFGYSDVLGPEDFYSFQVQTSGDITFTVTPSSLGFDAAIYLLENGVLGTNAVAGADALGDGGIESFTYSVVAGRQYYFAVDSWANASDPTYAASSQGAYGFTMSGDAQLVPEPATLSLLAIGALAAGRRRIRKA